jgi:hypothetical protein
MRVIGFNLSKVLADRHPDFKQGAVINTDIEFTNVEKEEVEILKETEASKISFQFSVSYLDSKEKKAKKQAEIVIEGNIILSASSDEIKELAKAWKKRELPNNFKVPLFNLILKKCTPKAIQLEDELNLPTHIPLPQLRPQTQNQQP